MEGVERHRLLVGHSQDNHHNHSLVREVEEELAVAMVRLGDLEQIHSRLDGLAAKVEAKNRYRDLVAPVAMEQRHQSAVWPKDESHRRRHRRHRKNLLDRNCLVRLQYDQQGCPRGFRRVLA